MAMATAMDMVTATKQLEGLGAIVTLDLRTVLWRGTVALLCGLLAFASGSNAVVNVTSDFNPDLALTINPGNAQALAARADSQLANAQARFDVGALWQSVRSSLRTQALTAKSLRLAAVAAELRNNRAQASSLMILSNAASRREIGTQLWMINKAVEENNIPAALLHYDAALRSSDTVQATLFPTLLGALEEPAVRTGFGRLIRSDPPWMQSFLLQSIASSPSSQVIASTVDAAGHLPNAEGYRKVEKALVNKLIDQRHVVEARQLYLRLPGHDPRALSSTAFGNDSEIKNSGNMGWQLFSGAASGAEWLAESAGGRVRLQAYAGTGEDGHIARKVLYIGPGEYQLTIKYGDASATDNAAVRWDVRCADDEAKLAIWQVREPVSQNMTKRQYVINVNDNCVAYFLNVYVEGGSAQDGLNVIINNVNFVRRS